MARATVYNHITTEEKIAEINENNTWLMNEFLSKYIFFEMTIFLRRKYEKENMKTKTNNDIFILSIIL